MHESGAGAFIGYAREWSWAAWMECEAVAREQGCELSRDDRADRLTA